MAKGVHDGNTVWVREGRVGGERRERGVGEDGNKANKD